jgi:hypothetical protein
MASRHDPSSLNVEKAPSILNQETTGTEIMVPGDLERVQSENLRVNPRGRPRSTEIEVAETRSKRPRLLSVGGQMKNLFESWFSILLPCVPVGIALHFVLGDSVGAFAANFIAIIPLGVLSEMALDALGFYLGDLYGGLLYVSTR